MDAVAARSVVNVVNAVNVASVGNALNAATGAREAPGKAAKARKVGNSVHAAVSADRAARKRLKARQQPRRRVRIGPAAATVANVVIDRNALSAQSARTSHPSTRAPGW